MTTITGTSGNDILNGLEDNDIIAPGLGEDTVDGGGGTDTLVLNYSAANGGMGYYSGSTPSAGSARLYIGSNRLTYSNIEIYNIIGSQFNDEIYGGSYNDTINAGSGDDYVDGYTGADVLDGGTGTDTLRRDLSAFTTGSTVDNTDPSASMTLIGGTVAKNFENINVTLGSGNDTIRPGLGEDTVDGGSGTDTLVLNYSAANGGIGYYSGSTPSAGSARLYIGSNRLTYNNIEIYNIIGSQFNDEIYGGSYNDTINAGSGDDYVDGYTGADVLDGGTGTDTLRRNLSAFTTGSNVDNTDPSASMTLIDGTVAKNFENINVTLGSGNDTIKPGLGEDTVDGGGGTDTLVLNYSAANGGIGYYSGSTPSAGSARLYIGSNRLTYSNIEIYNIIGSQFNDEIYGGSYNDTINAGSGDDYVDGYTGADVLDGDTGTDTLRRDLSAFTTGSTVDNTDPSASMTLIGGTVAKNFENINVTLGSGNDTIKPGLGEDTVDGGGGTDTLVLNYSAANGGIGYYSGSTPSAGSARLYIGSNRLTYSNIEIYNIIGSQFNDEIYGGSYNDTLNGGNGNDYINGDAGNDILISVNSNISTPGLEERDTLKGGAGADKFILGDALWSAYDDGNSTSAGTNDYALITDFNATEDVIQLKGSKSDYVLGASPISGITGTAIFINKPGTEPDELIAVLQGVTGLNINSSAFVAALTTQTLAFSYANFFVSEAGTAYLPVTVTRTGNLSGTTSTQVNLSNGTATAPADYNNASINVSFASGETSKTVNIPIVNDTIFESTETVNLTLANPTNGATLGTQKTATLRIIDNDPQPSTLSFSSANFSVNENGTPVNAITVNRTGGTTATASATINFLLGGTATPTTDFNSTPVTVNFASGETTKTVTVPIVNDTLFESSETVKLVLTNPTGSATIGSTSTATLTIISDDPLNGTANNDTLTGFSSNDTINGLGGNDSLNGGTGNDQLVGGLGNDTIAGGAGTDKFKFNAPNEGIDRINDFSVVDDTIVVSAAGFGGGLIVGTSININQFVLGTSATDGSDRFIYDPNSGGLFFDRDGTGAIAKVQIATLNTALSLTYNDIAVVA